MADEVRVNRAKYSIRCEFLNCGPSTETVKKFLYILIFLKFSFVTDLCRKLRLQLHCFSRDAVALLHQAGQDPPSVLLWMDEHARRVAWLSHKGEDSI